MMGSRGVRGLLLAVVALMVTTGCTSDAVAVGSCPNEGFRVGPSAGLPDCRAYEMVSPPDKNGGQVDGGLRAFGGLVTPPQQAAVDGEAITYASTSPFIGTEVASALVATQYLSRRTADGWRTQAITPEQAIPGGKVKTIADGDPDFTPFQGFNEDLSGGFLLAWEPQPDPLAPKDFFNPYLFESASGRYRLLSDVEPPVQAPGPVDFQQEGFGAVYAGMSADAQHVVFEANDALTPEAIPGQVNLYEWSVGRPLELVSVLPDGSVDSSGTKLNASYPIEGELEPTLRFGSPVEGGIRTGFPVSFQGVLSSDGKRVFWSGGSSGEEQVYMHEIVGAGARTVDVSASQKSGEPNAQASFWSANSDGSLVYFTSAGELTGDSTAVPNKPDLYQYDTNSGALRDLTVDPNGGEAAHVLAMLGSGESEGITYVYFVARGRLAAGASAEANNLYVWQDGNGGPGSVKLIATLSESHADEFDFTRAVEERTSRVSPNGKFLAFQSAKPLTGYDSTPANGQPCPVPKTVELTGGGSSFYANTGGGCVEVFEYNAQSASLACASCDPSGLPATADSLVPEVGHLVENTGGWQSSTVQQRYLLDGGRLYFQSEDELLPEATNGKSNVYEYEPEGVGQCTASGSGSCLYLISSGKSSGNSFFADASADGRDVFILSDEQLVSQDGDEAIDMYDAREDGGFSSAQLPPCSGEACKAPITPAPAIYGAPSSATFVGAGDLAAGQSPIKPVAAKTKAKKKKQRVRRKVKGKAKRKARHKGRSARRSVRGRR